MKLRIGFLIIFVLFHLCAFCQSKEGMKIEFVNFVDTSKLILDSVQYKNSLGQTYSISKFRYYVGQFELKDRNGKVFYADEYHLIDQDELNSAKFTLKNVPIWNYDSISFIIGVDSLRNCSGLQEGDLDPLKGMFWAWNTGYIFLKLEGHSSASQSNGEVFEFHIGGYKAPSNAIRKVKLKILDVRVSDEKLPMKELVIKTDVAQILKQPVDIDFSKMSSVVDHKNAELVADNYSDMFSFYLVK